MWPKSMVRSGSSRKYPIEEFDFDAFVDGIGALIMGSTSYVQAAEWGWMVG